MEMRSSWRQVSRLCGTRGHAATIASPVQQKFYRRLYADISTRAGAPKEMTGARRRVRIECSLPICHFAFHANIWRPPPLREKRRYLTGRALAGGVGKTESTVAHESASAKSFGHSLSYCRLIPPRLAYAATPRFKPANTAANTISISPLGNT